jgi:predicted nucleic acid-binding Zn ribbon protein
MRSAARAGDLLAALLTGWGLDTRLLQYRALVIWDEVVGPQISARARPEKIRDGVLEVCVDQPTWMQQLQLLKPQILAKLNARLGDAPLSEIFLKRGKIAARSAPSRASHAPQWRSVALSTEELDDLRRLLQGVADAELRRELEALLVKQARLSKARRENL